MSPRRSGSSSSAPQTIRVASTEAEPLASLRSYRIQVDIGTYSWVIPAHDATAWLEVLLADDLDVERLFPGLCGWDVVAEVNFLLAEQAFTVEQLSDAVCDVITAASGRNWWITLRLCRFLRVHWDRVGGELAASGINPDGMPLGRWLDAAYGALLRVLQASNPEQLGELSTKLTQPPPGRSKETFNLEASRAAFRAAMQRAR